MNLKTLKAKLARPDAVPPGWKTRLQWAYTWKLAPAQCGRHLVQAIKAGLCTCKPFRIFIGNRVLPVPHYKFNE